MEATGYARWFERLLAELGFKLWIGDPAAADARKSLSANFDTESGESGPSTTAVAPAPDGADEHADHEPTASVGQERREVLEIETV
jgi:hypothetical protein